MIILSVVLTQFILMVSWELRHREIWCYVPYILFHSPLKGEWLTFRHKTLSFQSHWTVSEKLDCQCVLVSCLFHAERTTSLLIETAEMITKAVAWENIYINTEGERAFYLEKFTVKLLDRMNNSWSKSTLSIIKKESTVIYQALSMWTKLFQISSTG